MAVTTTLHETLKHQDFDIEIEAHGIDVHLRQAIKCPCASETTRQPDPTCDQCDGWGYIWNAGGTVRAFGPNRRFRREYEEPGSLDLMDAMFSFQTGVPASHFDRFSVPTELISYSEIFTKGAVNALTGATKERSRFSKIFTPIERAVWSKRVPSTGTPYAYQLTDLVEGADFTVINNNEISWLPAGNPPDNGTRYSIRFRTEAEYVCWTIRSRAEGSQLLPTQWLCKRIDFIRAVQ